MSTPKFLAPAISADQLQAQVRDQELAFGMEVLGIDICQTADNPPLRNNFVELTSHLRDQLPELRVKIVASEIAGDDTRFADFLVGLGTETSIVDSAMVLI